MSRQSQRAGRCLHLIGRVDIVFEDEGNAVQGATRSLLRTFCIEFICNCQRIRVDFDDRVDGGALFV